MTAPVSLRLPQEVWQALHELPFLAEAGATNITQYIEWAAQNIASASVGDDDPVVKWAKHYRWMYRGRVPSTSPAISVKPSAVLLDMAVQHGLTIRELLFAAACRAAYYSRLEVAETSNE